MTTLPDRPDLDHLRKQAKELLARYRHLDPTALNRFRMNLPAAFAKDDAAIATLGLRLHDAQSCIAREYGLPSWADLKSLVDTRRASVGNRTEVLLDLLRLIYPADIVGGSNRARPAVAARILEDSPTLLADDPYLACAIGNEARLRQATKDNTVWVNRPGGPLNLPPLVAVTHSSLMRIQTFRDGLLASARLLLEVGANANQTVGSRWQPASLTAPSEVYRLSALYGAAGQNRDPELTKLLLDAGADPNDGESLYHSLENRECTRLLLTAGARIAGSNALYRVLDLDDVEALRLLLSHGADPNEPATSAPTSDWGSPLLWAIRRRRSRTHVAVLLDAGATRSARTPDGTDAHTWAQRFGLPDVAELLSDVADTRHESEEEQFIAACTVGDEVRARRIQSTRPDLPIALSELQLRLLPELAAQGCAAVVKLMVKLGWPIATLGGDWSASALNHAVFRGDAELVRFLLEQGANWMEQHGHGDNACGTLSWASCNEPVEGGNWLGCAEALVAHGMPTAKLDPKGPESVIVDGKRKWFSDDIREFLLQTGTSAGANSAE
jgi:ankyrin repeat protein